VLGAIIGVIGGRLVVLALNRVALPQGLHAPFVTTAALVIFGAAQIAHASGFLAVYLAGIIIGNRPTRAHNSVVTFLDAATWLAQIVMFVLLGLLVSPQRLVGSVGPAVIVALVLMLVARPLAVFLCLAPFRFNWREKTLHRLDRPARRGRDLPGVDPDAGRAVEGLSLFRRRLCRRHHLAAAAGLDAGAGGAAAACGAAARRSRPRRVELDLPGQLEQQLVGYPVRPKSLYFRRGLIPSWSKPTLVIRDERILSPAEADPIAAGDYIYLLAPPEKAEALDRFFVDMAPSTAPDPHLLGDFTVSGEHTLGELAEIYGVNVDEEQAKLTLADYFDIHLDHAPKEGATLALDSIVLVARSISGGRVNVVGLRLPEDEEEAVPVTRLAEVQAQAVGDLVVGGGDLGRQLAHFAGVVADIDHRHAGFVAQPHQIGQDLDLALLVERAQRLVQQQQARLRQQRAAERDALALAAGELAGTAIEQAADVEQVDDARALRRIVGRRFMRRP
jgi:cell volume regulation protein A